MDELAAERKVDPLPLRLPVPVLFEAVRLGLVSGAILVPDESSKSVSELSMLRVSVSLFR